MVTGSVRAEHAVTSGTFTLDGQTFAVDNNVWVVGDDTECVVIDAPHDVAVIAALVGSRQLLAVLCTHAHDDHVRYAPALGERFAAPVLLHPADLPVWALTHPDQSPDDALTDGQLIRVGAATRSAGADITDCITDGTDVVGDAVAGGVTIQVVHTPGHTPGAVCFFIPQLGVVFTGDTLFAGGPGATGRLFSDYPTIVASIRDRLFTLPAATVVHTGHGDDTTIGTERERPPP